MGNLDAALKRYYHSISKELPCPRKTRVKIMQQIQSSVNLFLEHNPDADFHDVQVHFGEPQTIALSYIEDQDAPELLRKMHIKRKVIAIVATTMALILAIWTATVIWGIIDAKQDAHGNIVVDIGEE